jgi:hypothetical protein
MIDKAIDLLHRYNVRKAFVDGANPAIITRLQRELVNAQITKSK